jgi:hypothetical protein
MVNVKFEKFSSSVLVKFEICHIIFGGILEPIEIFPDWTNDREERAWADSQDPDERTVQTASSQNTDKYGAEGNPRPR